jgi:hypothetical protein
MVVHQDKIIKCPSPKKKGAFHTVLFCRCLLVGIKKISTHIIFGNGVRKPFLFVRIILDKYGKPSFYFMEHLCHL